MKNQKNSTDQPLTQCAQDYGFERERETEKAVLFSRTLTGKNDKPFDIDLAGGIGNLVYLLHY